MKHEYASLNHEREVEADIRRALALVGAGATKCQECRWQIASVVARRRRLLCASCAKVERAMRNMDAAAARLNRKANRG